MKSAYALVARFVTTVCSRASRRVRLQKENLKELQRFSQSLIEDAPFSIISISPSGTVTAMNRAAERLTLYSRHELMGKKVTVLHDPAELQHRSEILTRELNRTVAPGFDPLVAGFGRRRSHESNWNYIRRDGSSLAVHLTLLKLRGEGRQTTGYLAIAFDVAERKALTDSIVFLSHHDSLTKLPNRSLIAECVRTAIDEAVILNLRVALFVIDIDHFKRVNDSLGHDLGDRVLVHLGQLIKATIRTGDMVARFGGDEFIVMMPDAGEVSDIVKCGERLVEVIRNPFQIEGRTVTMTASIGLCTFPEMGKDFDALLRHADTAMYAAKHRGRNCLERFSETMLQRTADRLELEADIRMAIESDQFSLHYQAQVDAKTRHLTGVEALLRWHHPSRGDVPPGEFIEAAEESGMIVPIGEWVVRKACQEVRALQIETNRRFTIAVNLSPYQVVQHNLFEVVESALQNSGLAAEDLELEITENTLMISSPETASTLGRIRDLGVKLAVDDFGTGFSSFRYILEHKVDRLKIDRSFVAKCATDETSAAVVRAVIDMAHGLHLSVVAEGVEASEQLDFLLSHDCDVIQGYLFGVPESLYDLRERLVKVMRADVHRRHLE